MKKLIAKDRKLRYSYLSYVEKKHLILKLILKNFNFFSLTRWSVVLKLELLTKNNSKISMINHCLLTFNKKRFNKMTLFSRHVFLKLVRSNAILNFRKSS